MIEVRRQSNRIDSGVTCAVLAAVLFGTSTPTAKILLGGIKPVLLAGLMYFGSGLCLGLWWLLRRGRAGRIPAETPLARGDLPWLAGAVFSGGMVGPALLMLGLTVTAGSTASLLLNLEGVFTAAAAWFIFREHFSGRVVLGMAAIVAGGVILSWAEMPQLGVPWGPLAIIGACMAWAMDNNLTRRISGGAPVQIAALKGLTAGAANIALGLLIGSSLPSWPMMILAGVVGLMGYGISLVLFVLALRRLGTARTSAYFSVAPFIGASIAIGLLAERPTLAMGAAAVLMGIGVYLHLTENHEHRHFHEITVHAHRHVQDEHHRHVHEGPVEEPHAHEHHQEPMVHVHPHYPDLHHRHKHRTDKE